MLRYNQNNAVLAVKVSQTEVLSHSEHQPLEFVDVHAES